MAKEFNIDDYQYIENVLTVDEWLNSYKPQLNRFNDGARFDGLLYEHQSEEWEHVVSRPVHNLWTLFQDEGGALKIKNGLTVRGRVGYFVSEIQHNPHQTFVVNEIPSEKLSTGQEG